MDTLLESVGLSTIIKNWEPCYAFLRGGMIWSDLQFLLLFARTEKYQSFEV